MLLLTDRNLFSPAWQANNNMGLTRRGLGGLDEPLFPTVAMDYVHLGSWTSGTGASKIPHGGIPHVTD